MNLTMWQESFSSCAISNSRLGEVCSETLHRMMTGQPAGDRYILGLAWAMRDLQEIQDDHTKV